MSKKKITTICIICFIVSIVLFVLDYIFFHYLTDSGFTSIKQEEAGKPFVTNLVGILATLYFFAASFLLIVRFVAFQEHKK